MTESLYPPSLAAHLAAAESRLVDTLRGAMPHLGPRVLEWLESLAGGPRIGAYFTHPRRFPMLLFPWWASQGTPAADDSALQLAIAYSTMAGYSFIRLLDDLVDRPTPDERLLTILPAAAVFHTEFFDAYREVIPSGSGFWPRARAIWLAAADAAVDQPRDRSPDPADFARRTEARLGPALIPVLALSERLREPDRFEAWRGVVAAIGQLEQLLDDLTDWLPDFERGRANFIVARGLARKAPDEPLPAWVLREGLAWGLVTAETALARAADVGRPLGSPGLTGFLDHRRALLGGLHQETRRGLAELARLERNFDR